MNEVIRRILQLKVQSKKSWDEIVRTTKIRLATWMIGKPIGGPTDDEIHRLADYFNVSYKWLKYGEE